MRLSKTRKAGRAAYRHVSDGLRAAGEIVEKTAHVYQLTHPLLRQSFDTRKLDEGLIDAYRAYQKSREFVSQIDAIIT
jgi:hypothetical protein